MWISLHEEISLNELLTLYSFILFFFIARGQKYDNRLTTLYMKGIVIKLGLWC